MSDGAGLLSSFRCIRLLSSLMRANHQVQRIVAGLVLGWCGLTAVPGQTYTAQHVIHLSTDSAAHGAKLGWSMAVAGDLLAVGSPHFASQRGRVSVLQLDELPSIPAPLQAQDVLANPAGNTPLQQRFGASLALSGAWLAVGNCSPYGTSQYCNASASRVLVYQVSDADVQAYQVVQQPPGATGGAYGKALAMESDVLAVGGARTGTGSNVRDVVYLYRLVGGLWQLRDSLFGEGNMNGGEEGFGQALALSNSVLAVGASGDDELGTDCGAVYLFGRDQGGQEQWGLVRKLLPSNGLAGDRFGTSVALREGRCVVGAPKRSINGVVAGSAYVYDRDAGLVDNWGEVAYLKPIDTVSSGMDHGASVAIGADRVAVGAPLHDLQIQDEGSVHLYRKQGAEWTSAQRIAPNVEGVIGPVGRAGTSLSFHGDRLLIGAPFAIVNGLTPPQTVPTGAVLVYAEEPVGFLELSGAALRLWPNPVDEVLWFSGLTDTRVRAEVQDGLGRTVLELGTIYGEQGSWSLSGLGNGYYLLVLGNEKGERIVRPFVKA